MPIIGRPSINSTDRSSRDGSTSQSQPSKWSSTRRGPSGPWNRLKSAPRDELAEYGFPSKGETRLNNNKAQEAFFHHIFERYMRFCHDSRKDLANEFAKLSFAPSSQLSTSKHAPKPPSPPAPSRSATPSSQTTATTEPTAEPAQSTEPSPELTLIHTAMRKLRESLLSTHRTDDFARTTYLFITRATILSKLWEAYVPALSHLVHVIHAASPLTDAEYREVSTYQILDLACRQRDVAAAIALQQHRRLQDVHVADVLRALVRDEWWRFWNARRNVDGYVRAVMEWAEEDVCKHALKCLARTYFDADKAFVEKTAGREWEVLVKQGVGWELERREDGREVVVIRRAKDR